MVLTTSSIGLVIWLSISSGEAPGSRVVMVMVGRSTLGKMSTPSWTNEASPSTTRVAMTMVVKTGRRTKTSRKPTTCAGRSASIRVTGAPLKSWERFEIATVSPGFTPSGISTQAPWRAPALDRAAPRPCRRPTTNTLLMPTKYDDGLGGHERRRGVLPRQHVALGEEAGAQPRRRRCRTRPSRARLRVCTSTAGDTRVTWPANAAAGVGLHRQLDALADLEIGREALGHRARVLERVERHQVEERRVVLDVLAGVHEALGDHAGERRADRGVAEPLLRDAEGRLAPRDLGLGDAQGGAVGVELRLGRCASGRDADRGRTWRRPAGTAATL